MPSVRKLLSAFFVLVASLAPAQSPKALHDKVVQNLPQWLKTNDVPSASIAYIADGKIAWTAVSGEQSAGVPATDKTLYNVASLTKPVTAELILRLASQNKLSLDEPLSPYWVDPDIKDNPWNKLLTPRLCLTHQTGFANWRRMTNKVLTFQWEPGTRTGYSGEGYMYLAHYAQNKFNKPFDQLEQEYVLDPIGMHDTAFNQKDWFAGRIAVPYSKDGFLEPHFASPWSAADLLRTTPSDYARFVISVMHNDGVTPAIAAQRLVISRNWVSPEDEKDVCAHEAPNTTCHLAAGMGLGWQVIEHNGVTIIEHSGSDIGDHTVAFFVPKKQIGAVIFTNGDNGPKVIAEIIRTLYSDPVYAYIESK